MFFYGYIFCIINSPGFVVTTKDKIDLYRDKYLENIKKKRNANGNNEDILKYDKWMAYINEGSEVVQPNKKRKLIQVCILCNVCSYF